MRSIPGCAARLPCGCALALGLVLELGLEGERWENRIKHSLMLRGRMRW